jgi:hypothetical protein
MPMTRILPSIVAASRNICVTADFTQAAESYLAPLRWTLSEQHGLDMKSDAMAVTALTFSPARVTSGRQRSSSVAHKPIYV